MWWHPQRYPGFRWHILHDDIPHNQTVIESIYSGKFVWDYWIIITGYTTVCGIWGRSILLSLHCFYTCSFLSKYLSTHSIISTFVGHGPVIFLVSIDIKLHSWWRHQMKTFSTLLAICAGKSPDTVNFLHKGRWRGALMCSLICAWTNGSVNNHEAGDLRHHRAHYDVTIMMHWHYTGLALHDAFWHHLEEIGRSKIFNFN